LYPANFLEHQLSRTLHIKSRLADERGTAVVEFAIVLPILAVVLFGIIDFGRILNYWNDENQMAADGARWAAVNRNPASSGSLQDYIQGQADTTELKNGTTGDGVSTKAAVTIWTSGKVGDPVRVCVTSKFHFFKILDMSADLPTHGAAEMRLEQAPTTWTPDGAYRSDCPAPS
jgi:Flp pilus assembly protein TadG